MKNPAVLRDAFYLMVDHKIGSGMSREVYSSSVFPDSVVKVEAAAGFFQNVIEWETWQRVKDTPFAKWFAPCEYISPNGAVLVMKKTIPARADEYPDRMPPFLTDLKRANYGIYNGKLVCHDYGTNLLMESGMTKRMRKAHWWN